MFNKRATESELMDDLLLSGSALAKNLAKQTSLAIIVNDLHRHAISYFSIRWLSTLFGLSDLAKHDGPLSVKRAFSKNDLINLLKAANLSHYQIRWAFAFRWQLIIWTENKSLEK